MASSNGDSPNRFCRKRQRRPNERRRTRVLRERHFGREHELIIEPGRTERHYWRDLWHYRELFQVLAWRDISVRYKQTVIGAAWALIRPVPDHGGIHQLSSANWPSCPRTARRHMPSWSLPACCRGASFQRQLDDASNSLIGNANLISKVYFPRLIVPIAAVMVAFVDFLISFAILVVLMIWYQFMPGWQILLSARIRGDCVHGQPRCRRCGSRRST